MCICKDTAFIEKDRQFLAMLGLERQPPHDHTPNEWPCENCPCDDPPENHFKH